MPTAKYMRAYRTKRRAWALEALGGKCTACGDTDNLNFDHIDPEKKNFPISTWSMGFDKIKAELALCQLLCAPCHIEKSKSEGSFSKKDQTGEKNHATKVTEEEVLEIRKRAASGEKPVARIGKDYGLGRHATYQIVRRQTWKHI